MISSYLREQKRYTQEELSSLLKCNDEEIVPLIRKMKEYGIVKTVKATEAQKNLSDLADEDNEVVDVEAGENEYFYVFTFVGVIVIGGRVLKCYPKYLLETERPKDELCQVIKVLEKYNSQEQVIQMYNDSSESASFNLLAVLLYLLQDYYENGVYNRDEEIFEINGVGEIIWDKTINEAFALLLNNRPYYTELQTRKRINNDYDYFKRLHECIITKASKELEDADLLDLFEITAVNLSDEALDDFGDKQYILYRIENELNVQFNTRKQLVLKTIYAYVANNGNLYDIDCLSMFGTTYFNIVWEKICAEVMDNQLNTYLYNLPLPCSLKEKYNPNNKLIELVEKPLWTATQKRAKDTLKPDIISIVKIGKEWQFFIFDAKYYNAQLIKGEIPKGQPGVESVTKQYLYQLAYQSFIDDHEFSAVKNCFLLPTEAPKIIDGGEASMQMLEKIGLQNIKVRFLPASMVYDLYLSGEKLSIDVLNL